MADDHETKLDRLVALLIRYRLVLLPVMLLVTGFAWPLAQKLTFDQSIESLYALDDPYLLEYQESKRLFGGDEFVMVAWSDSDLFVPDKPALTEAAEKDIRDFADRLSEVPGVKSESTQDLASALRFRYRPKSVLELVETGLISADRQTTAVILRLLPETDAPVSRGKTFHRIRELADAHDPPAYVVGEPVQIHDMFHYVEEDGALLFRVSLLLLGGVIYVFFRSPRWVLLSLLVVVAAILWTEAAFVLSGARLSMVSSMLNSLVTIIGIATVTHVTVRFRDLRASLDRAAALHQTFVQLLPAIFWTCATTSVGFAALLSSDITPVRSFGVMMALATLLVLAATVTGLPGGILLGRIGTDPHQAPAEARLVQALGRITEWVARHPRPLTVGTVVVVGLAAVGFTRLQVETDFSKNFRASSPIVQSLNFVETRLGGAGTWEVNFAAPSEVTADYLADVDRLAADLRKLQQQNDGRLTKVVSLADGVELVPYVPLILNTLRRRLNVLSSFQPEFETSLYNAEQARMRIMLRALEQQSADDKMGLIDEAERVGQRHFPDAKATGLFVLLAHLIESLLRDQLVSFAIAAVGIATMMTIAFRSLRIGLISLVPNLFPIVLLIGSMGWIGLPINIGTAMIASVSMGLTVDSSIHYLTGYRRARAGGLPVVDALKATHQGVGRALVFANVALVIGFTVLTLSHFIPLIYFGVLVSVAMLGGLTGNLVLLPLLLQWTEGTDSADRQVSDANNQS